MAADDGACGWGSARTRRRADLAGTTFDDRAGDDLLCHRPGRAGDPVEQRLGCSTSEFERQLWDGRDAGRDNVAEFDVVEPDLCRAFVRDTPGDPPSVFGSEAPAGSSRRPRAGLQPVSPSKVGCPGAK